MRINNNLFRTYPQKATHNTSGKIPPEFQINFDNYNKSLENKNAGNSSNPLIQAPQEVKDAWEEAEKELKEELGYAPDGRLSQIFGYVIAQLEQRFQTGNGDMFGQTRESALSGAQKILDRLNDPLTPPSSAEAAELSEKEKQFYEAFIKNLSNLPTEKQEVTPLEVYKHMSHPLDD